jgi:hypothetical protein
MEKDYELKCADETQKFPTGAIRDSQVGKGRFDLLPPAAMVRLARHFEKGAVKYGANNYLKGIPLSRYLDSALRHAFSFLAGKDDEDHLVAAAWNFVAALETQSRVAAGQLSENLIDVGPGAPKINDTKPEPGPVPQEHRTTPLAREFN